MLRQILIGAGLLALGFYVGREIGRTEHVRRELARARRRRLIEHAPSNQGAEDPAPSRS